MCTCVCLCVCVQEGLVKANMEKLTFFALSAPEKLDRIAAYLSERLTRELNRHRYGLVHHHSNAHTHTNVSAGPHAPAPQVRVHRYGGNGTAAAGLSLPEHQPAGGELPQHAPSAARGRQTSPSHPCHQLGKQHPTEPGSWPRPQSHCS